MSAGFCSGQLFEFECDLPLRRPRGWCDLRLGPGGASSRSTVAISVAGRIQEQAEKVSPEAYLPGMHEPAPVALDEHLPQPGPRHCPAVPTLPRWALLSAHRAAEVPATFLLVQALRPQIRGVGMGLGSGCGSVS
jgi:hypothetical protein